MRCIVGGALAVVFLAAGCHSDPIEAPTVNPQTAAAAALRQYDSNQDGFLDSAELDKAPGIKAALPKADADADGRLDGGELAARVKKIVGDEVGVMSLEAVVRLDGQPLPNADVRFIPEPCLGSQFKPGSGKTAADGRVQLRMESSDLPGMQCGWFQIQVSQKDELGNETLAAQFNTATTLGAELALDVDTIERGFVIELTSSRGK